MHNSYNIPLGATEKVWDFMDSCSLFLLLSPFFGGYDLYIIAIMGHMLMVTSHEWVMSFGLSRPVTGMVKTQMS